MSKNSIETNELERFRALLAAQIAMKGVAARLEKVGAAAAQARIARLRDWLIGECENLQRGAYRELARRMEKRDGRSQKARRSN